MDSLTYEFRINMEYYESLEFCFDEVRVVGGVSKSPCWMQIKADILNRDVMNVVEKRRRVSGSRYDCNEGQERLSDSGRSGKGMREDR